MSWWVCRDKGCKYSPCATLSVHEPDRCTAYGDAIENYHPATEADMAEIAKSVNPRFTEEDFAVLKTMQEELDASAKRHQEIRAKLNLDKETPDD